MPITLVRSENTHSLWNHCRNNFLDEIGSETGPGSYPSFLWITNRNLRDSFLEYAHAKGLKGWLGPPFKTWSELPESFGIRERTIGLLTRQLLIGQLAREVAEKIGFDSFNRETSNVLPGQMIDRLLADFLPEGLTPETLEESLASLPSDDFGLKRNQWIVETYRRYLLELEHRGVRDIRSLNSLLATKIDSGELPNAISNAKILHIYGLATVKNRKRLLTSLSQQENVETIIYLPKEEEMSEWDNWATQTQFITDSNPIVPEIQSASDSSTEAQWVTTRIKKLLVTKEVDLHEIAVISRSPEKDSSQISAELQTSGVPITLRTQVPMLECGVISAFRDIYSASSKGWTYKELKKVLKNPYITTGINPDIVDRLPMKQGFVGLAEWEKEIQNHKSLPSEKGLVENFMNFTDLMEPFSKSHSLASWIKLGLKTLQSDPFELKLRASEEIGDNWSIVRTDQRALVQLESIFREWLELADPTKKVQPSEWNALVYQVLNAQYLSLETPLKKGVQILGATEAILSNFRYTFIINANHDIFPKAFRSSGIFSNQERNRLAKLGIPIPNHSSEQRHERSIWRAVAQQPEVTISYRTSSSDEEISEPSVMVPQHICSPITKNTLQIETNKEALLISNAKTLVSSRNAESLLPVKTPDPQILKHAIIAAHAESNRPGTKIGKEDSLWLQSNPWNGEIGDVLVKDYLSKCFREDHVWTAGDLEKYSTLPFNFWMTKVLKIEKSGKIEEETSPLISGSLAHKILERFYRALKEHLPKTLGGESLDQLNNIVDEVIEEHESSGKWLGEWVLWKQECEKIRSEIQNYLTFELPYLNEQGHSPFLLEYKFGFEEPVTISGKNMSDQEQSLKIRGVVDRVDLVKDGEDTYSILDYKRTATPTTGGYIDGSVLQAPIYLLALQQQGYKIDAARYRSIRNPEKAKQAALIKADSEKLYAVLKIAFSIPERIMQGKFEPIISLKTGSWRTSDPGLEVSRSLATIPSGNRFSE